MPRVLLLLPTTTYRTEAFLNAAARLGVDVTAASERPNALEHLNPAGLLTLDFHDPERAAQQVREFSSTYPIDAVVPVDSQVVLVGATICQSLGLRHNSVESVAAAQDKHRMRQKLQQAGVASPRFRLYSLDESRSILAGQVDYPCVVKPLSLSASQGVMRADNEKQFVDSVDRLEAILRNESGSSDTLTGRFLVEEFVDGQEVALEAMLTRGDLRVLALFDKPDVLDGPYFEETIYVTPSRHAVQIQNKIAESAQQATRAIGLEEGPVHVELRLSADGPCVIEVNARSIGGYCSRVLRFGTGLSLEELIIRHALEEEFELVEREHEAGGVMMIPIPRAGRLVEIRGVQEAKAVSGIADITISAHLGQTLVPLPEGSRYLGFIFSKADSPEAAEKALREAHSRLEFVIEPSGAKS